MSKINATQAHNLADNYHSSNYTAYLSDVHSSLKRLAERGSYEKTIEVPTVYSAKTFAIVSYFRMFGYQVTTNRRNITIKW